MNEAADLAHYFDRLWPLNRSLTGDPVRQTHDILSELAPLSRTEVPSGTSVFDWKVPPEWKVRQAYIVAPDGSRVADVANNNLHLVSYSIPFRGRLSRAELDKHLYSLQTLPDAIPYVTSYYKRRWGFCITQRTRDALPEGYYEVVVDTELDDAGSMTMGEVVLPGSETGEVLFSTYTCHPSLANNELSGPLVAAFLCRRLAKRDNRRFTYRFSFHPETIGAIAYLARSGEHLRAHLRAGYVLTCLGTNAAYSLRFSRQGNSLADRAAALVLKRRDDLKTESFAPDSGSDERQYCSQGFNLPVSVIMRSRHGRYPEYHTSDDNKCLMDFDAMVGAIDTLEEIVGVLERNATYQTLKPFCEPHLEKYGLYDIKGPRDAGVAAVMWLMDQSDGKTDVLTIAEKSGRDFVMLADAADACERAGLIKKVG